MALAPQHPDDAARLAALRSYEILDTDPESEYDEIAHLAGAICDMPVALISFVDADRQWFKSATGIDRRETSLTESICTHAFLGDDILEIADTQDDPRTIDNPLCTGREGFRFYAGAVLKTSDGLPLGTLCVLGRRPAKLTPLQRDTLRVLAAQIMARMELRKSLAHAEMLRKEVDHRVKNSLQSLASLVRLAARRARHRETAEALSTLQSRIDAVARLHEELYRSDGGRIVDLGRYMANLTGHLAEIAPSHVRLQVKADNLAVSSEQAVAVGTLVNEFVQNSFKHAFPDGRHGMVHVTAERGSGDGKVQLTCRDDGVGLPDIALGGQDGLGMQIAAIISAELQGDLNIQSSEGEGLTIGIEFVSAAG